MKRARAAFYGASVAPEQDKASIAAKIFIADGKLEETYGDIAVLVDVLYRDGQKLSGVAFYEAKCRDWEKHTLPAAKRPQLTRMHKNLWNGNCPCSIPESCFPSHGDRLRALVG